MAKKPSNAWALALVVAAMAGLQGCSYPDALNPIEWYRDLTGASKNDDADKTQRNAQNLEAGNKAPYPNLASVPAAPDRAMSTIDREKLQKGLVADRTNAQYSDEELRQGRPVPPLPGDPPVVPTAPDTASAVPGAAAVAPGTGGTKRSAPVKGSERSPQESPLTTPQLSGTPRQGDALHPAPPPPPGVSSPSPQKQLAAAVPRLPTGMAPAGAAGQPAIMRAPRGKGPAVSLEAAEISFAVDGKSLSAEDNQRLTEAAKLFQGASWMRVIGYARRGSGADAVQQELDGFGEAMDRAGTVAQALAKLGVPASRITVQTAPELVGGGLAAGRAEVFLEY